jgi:hypothetical protein
MKQEYSAWQILSAMGMIGIITALGQLLASEERLTCRIIIGRTLSSIGLAVSAGTIMLWFTDPHPLALIGMSAGAASLGTSFLERIIQKKLGIS